MAKQRILIFDVDAILVQTLREHLLQSGFEVSSQQIYRDTRFLKEPNRPHLIIVDPAAMDTGLEIIRQIRAESQVPLIVLTAKNDVADRVLVLEAGADDSMAKPVEPRELIARINSVLRRAPSHMGSVEREPEAREWHFKGLTIQSNRRRVLVDGQTVELTTAEFDLLRLLAGNAEAVMSREKILEELRGIEWESIDRSIDILISRLRDKINDEPRKPRFIRTVRSVGYQFIGEPADPPSTIKPDKNAQVERAAAG